MKKILFILITIVSFQSCNYLDFDETSGQYTREDIYEYYSKSAQMLTNVYRYMPQDFGAIGGAMRECGSDDAEYANSNGSVQSFNNGNWSVINTPDSQWNLYWGIRAANEFLESIATVDFSRFEHDTRYDDWMEQLAFHPYEARVLRAHYFFELARRYGDIAMPLKMLTVDEANKINKTKFNDVVEFIVKECDECANVLPTDYTDEPNREFGRITRGFAMAVKSKALLYAASELHNADMDKTKWERSAQAALDIINFADSTNAYALDPKGVVFGHEGDDLSSQEIVLVRLNGNYNSSFERRNFPIRFTEGRRTEADGTFPTQNLIDAFQTKSGYSVSLSDNGWVCADPSFDGQRPYLNRDPRFERTVLANNMSFKGSTIEVYEDGRDHAPIADGGTITGYFLRKYLQEETSFIQNAEIEFRRYWVIYRYAETLLTYAESMIQAFDDPNYTDEVFTLSAINALDQVRVNAAMPTLAATPATPDFVTKEGFVKALRNEWRVEFAFEDHRFWDIRRWKIGGDTQVNIYGVNVQKNTTGAYTFRRILCERRYWNDKMNLYPIPQKELFNNPNLAPQNVSW